MSDYPIIVWFVSGLLWLATGLFMLAGLRVNAVQSTFLTKLQAFCGVALFAFTGILLLAAFQGAIAENGTFFVGGIIALSSLLFAISSIWFCARFSATCRRIQQLEELFKALTEARVAQRKSSPPNSSHGI